MAEERESNKRSVGQLRIDVDCSEAMRGLKAVTREAKRATAALEKLEEKRKQLQDMDVLTINEVRLQRGLRLLPHDIGSRLYVTVQ